jgi:hypothetical protein
LLPELSARQASWLTQLKRWPRLLSVSGEITQSTAPPSQTGKFGKRRPRSARTRIGREALNSLIALFYSLTVYSRITHAELSPRLSC